MKILAVFLLATLASASKPTAWKRIHANGGARITGGDEVVPNSVPFQAGLLITADDGDYFCGGSLLSETLVLTAAHCAELSDVIQVVLGAHNIRNGTEPNQQRIKAKTVTIHSNWDSNQLLNDIAIIELATPAQLNEAVATIPVPKRSQASDNFAGITGFVSGWGRDSDTSETISPVLRITSNPIISNAQCRQEFGLLGLLLPLHPTNVCLTGIDGKSTCNGDSGGPLFVKNQLGKPFVVGLTSFGTTQGCEVGNPSVYTRLTEYLDWLELHGVPIP